MTVFVLQVLSKTPHPYADTLTVYQMGGVDDEHTIIANQENVYDVDALVCVALPDTILQDGTHIKRTKIRGVTSEGMAMGISSLFGLGEDVTEFLGATEFDRGGLPPMVPWPSVGGLHNVRKYLHAMNRNVEGFTNPTLTYRAKVKLDGTNAAVQIFPDGSVYAQSRGRVITPSDDNMGFAKWVEEHKDYFASLHFGDQRWVVFGEWCGEGIQKRCSISKVKGKNFAVFALLVGEGALTVDSDALLEIVGGPPGTGNEQAGRFQAPRGAHVLPWYGEPITLDWADKEALTAKAQAINAMVADVEGCDPWVAATFNVEGMGEGVVLYPQDVSWDDWGHYAFKAKGDKHKVVNQKEPVQLDPEVASSVEDFVALFVTEPRCEQGVAEGCGGDLDVKRTGAFLKWISQDILKESEAELEASGLDWKQVAKPVSVAARNWYLTKVIDI